MNLLASNRYRAQPSNSTATFLMKLNLLGRTRIGLAAVTLLAATSLPAADMLMFAAKPNQCEMTVDGTSNIHDWTVTTRIVAGFFKVEPAFLKDPTLKSVPSLNSAKTNPTVKILIPVRSLKSHVEVGREHMDQVMYEHMHMKDHSRIEYNLVEMVLKKSPAKPGGPFILDTKGALTVNGITRTNAMQVTMERPSPDVVVFKGQTKVKMTDFGIQPPAPKIAFGLIKTGDEVKLHFVWTAQLRPSSK